ncbi:MAG: FeoA family protein [Leptospiraceae bacterium]|nr:FeoA family protein [Leptospiraceae bacterium]
MNLAEVNEGETCLLSRIDSKFLTPEFINDLMDIGLLPGSSIKIIKRFARMNKILIQVGEGEIGIRLTDAKYIEVKI